MKVLAIKNPWASLIAEGIKTIEVRSRATTTRGKIGIYASLSPWNDGTEKLEDLFPENYIFPNGAIIATAELYDCIKFDDNLFEFEFWNDKHHVLDAHPAFIGEGSYGWCLENIQKLEDPVPFRMPKGAVIWANADLDL